jgi:predicted SprT family Zn-dependent metalloprotease
MAYARDDYEPPDNGRGGRDHTVAHCSSDWRYGHACITWNMSLVREQSDDKLEVVFVHELMHIFVNEMRWTADNSDDSIDHEERVVSTLTKAFPWLRDHLVEQQQQQPAIHTED